MDEQTKQKLRLGRDHYAKGELEKAEPLLREVLAASSHHADVHDMLGVILHRRGELADAERHFKQALALNPSYTEAALNLAVTYNDRGKYEAARQLLAEMPPVTRGASSAGGDAEKISDPFARGKIANMHAEVGDAYAGVGLLREAIGEYQKAVALCPEFADLHTRLGVLLRDSNDLMSARKQFESAISARPSYVPARLHLGATLLATGERQQAEVEWRKVLELDPENGRAKMYLRVALEGGSLR